MQETRRLILDILRRRAHATVDEIVDELQRRRGSITAVTVRHHLMRLQEDGLDHIAGTEAPQFTGTPAVYLRADREGSKTCSRTTISVLRPVCSLNCKSSCPTDRINVILEGVADTMAHEALVPDLPMIDRLDVVVDYLNQNGYEALWERSSEGFVLTTANCPYHGLSDEAGSLCQMDMRLISSLLRHRAAPHHPRFGR